MNFLEGKKTATEDPTVTEIPRVANWDCAKEELDPH
jgi:hypothetical protein